MSEIRVDTGNFLTAPFASLGRDVAELFRNPLAVLGGFGGMIAVFFLLFLGLTLFAGDASAQDDDPWEIEFDPGTLVKIGEVIEEEDQKIIVEETRPEEETVQETVTDDEKAEPIEEEEPPEPDEKPKKVEKPQPKVEKDKKLPTSKLPTQKNTPFNDLPTVKTQKGDPFGDPGGWDDLRKSGDAWATAVMAALNNMPVGAYAAQAKSGDFRFRITVCKDGRVGAVQRRGGSLPPDFQNAIQLELSRLKLPRPPADVARNMKSSCQRIQYEFVWSARGVR
jgi:hypothetical protein